MGVRGCRHQIVGGSVLWQTRLSLVFGMEANGFFLWEIWSLKKFSQSFKDNFKLLIVLFIFLFKRLNLFFQKIVFCEHLFDLSERPHDLDIDVNGSFAI